MPAKIKPETDHNGTGILIVEDSPTQAVQLKYLLEQNHFKVSVAVNGVQALSLLSEHKPQLVISDVVMPEMDGYELCRRIKADQQLEHLPVILVTSLSDVQDVLKGLECGADNFIRKPYDEKYLLSRIDYLLMNRAMRKDQNIQMGMEIYLSGHKHFITSERHQILDLLISTYEEAIRIKEELEVRQQELINSANYDQTHSAVLRLFNASLDRSQILHGMLDILARNHPFPVSAIYGYNMWGGSYHLEACHATPPGLRSEFGLDDGVMGQAARDDRSIVLPGFDATFFPATGADTFIPAYAAVSVSPVGYRGKHLAMLVLAANQTISERDQAFIERLASQLGVALHNVQQYDDLQLLAEQLRLRSEEIGSKNAQLEEASRMKSEFLANMSHELRTPLNAIIGFSELLRDGLAGVLSPQQREYTSDIFDSGQHLLSLINDVLDLSKIEAGKMVLEAELTDLDSLLQNSLSIIKEKAATHHIKLRLDASDALGECLVDPRKVKQIVYNLLSNAVKFTPEYGEVTLHVCLVDREQLKHRPVELPEVHTALPADVEVFLQITVSDTGIGIPVEDLPRLFQPFVQLESSLARRYEGTGLGLAMVRNLAELHGGATGVASQPGLGSIFTVWLPYRTEIATSPGAETVSGQASHPLPAGNTPLVLVVEDDDKAADLIRQQLEADGCRVIRTPTAEGALAMLNEEPLPDLVSLDILLPGMDGWEFLARLKSVPRLTHIPVVILSIVADSNQNKGLSLGASEVLQKPVSAEDLANALANLGMVPHPDADQPATVLVVDDDPKAVEIVASYLEHGKYSVLRAYSGNEGIQMARASMPDLIVLDLMMPEVSGFEVVETLRKQQKTAGIPILVLTAKLLTAEDRKLLNGHVLQVMEKSEFNHGNFISEVRRALGRKWGKPTLLEGELSPWQKS